jgi:hypothetical protein
MVSQAASGNPSLETYKDLKKNIEDMRTELQAKVLEIPTGPYMEAKRFLDHFGDSLRGVSNSVAAKKHFEYQKFSTGGKTAQELVQFVRDNGLTIAPANPGEEGAYEATYSVLANFDIAFNTQVASAGKGKKD